MKILFLTRSFYPSIGGVEKHVLEISKELIKRGHKVTVISEDKSPKNPNYQSKPLSAKSKEVFMGIKILRVPITTSERKKKFIIWQWLWHNRKLLKEADIIHVHDVAYWMFPFKFLLPSKKFFTTFHGYETVFPPEKGAILIRRISNFLSTGSVNVGDFIKNWYGTKPDFVTYGGINLLVLRIGQTRIHTIAPDVKTNSGQLKILFVGRIEEDSGVLIYEEVLKILENNKIKFEFEAIGDGSLRKIFERYGQVYGFTEEPEEYIKKSDMIFASSYLSILEAFKYKKIVASVYQNPLKRDYLMMTPFKDFNIVSDEAMKIAHKIIAFNENRKIFLNKQENSFNWVSDQTWSNLTDKYLKLWKK